MVHGTEKNVTEATYLGDVISAYGKNTKTIDYRITKVLGKITDIMNMIEKVKFGPNYFKKALLLREILFLSSLLTNSGV